MGEGLATKSDNPAGQDECFICGKNHPEPKPGPTSFKTAGKSGWNRVSMANVFDDKDPDRTSIYKDYPPSFGTEGHHCLAFSSFVSKDNDVFPRLNHYLDQVGFKPNGSKNIIQLPGRAGCSDVKQKLKIDVDLRYQTFYMAAQTGKPLQPHLGRHKKRYFAASDALVRRLAILAVNSMICEETSEDDMKKKIKDHADAAVNYAFVAVASAKWICHIEHMNFLKSTYQENTGSPLGPWPKPDLTCAPFG